MDTILVFDLMLNGFDPWEHVSLTLMTWALGILFLIFSTQLAPILMLSWLMPPLFTKQRAGFEGARSRPEMGSAAEEKRFRRILLVGMVVLPLFMVGFKLVEYSSVSGLRESYRSGTYSEIEGVVEQFRPARTCSGTRTMSSRSTPDTNGPSVESFRVGTTKFVYSVEHVNGGFRKTAACGGPIREGLHLKIWHVGGVIIRIESLRSETPG